MGDVIMADVEYVVEGRVQDFKADFFGLSVAVCIRYLRSYTLILAAQKVEVREIHRWQPRY